MGTAFVGGVMASRLRETRVVFKWVTATTNVAPQVGLRETRVVFKCYVKF